MDKKLFFIGILYIGMGIVYVANALKKPKYAEVRLRPANPRK